MPEKTYAITLSEQEKQIVEDSLFAQAAVTEADGEKYNKDNVKDLLSKILDVPENISSYKITIEYDDTTESPREWNTFGNMACWHRRYDLGDKHGFDDPFDFKRDLVCESAETKDIINYVLEGKASGLILEHDGEADTWQVKSYSDYTKEWYEEYHVEGEIDLNDRELAEALVNEMGHKDLDALAQANTVILPLYLYDHSLLSISADTFLNRAQHAEWDSGQVGYIYASHEDVQKEFGAVNAETLEKAQQLLVGEVEAYDYYLRGECYYVSLEKDGEVVDSCGGFMGDFNDVISSMKENCDEEFAELLDKVDGCGTFEFTEQDFELEESEEMEM